MKVAAIPQNAGGGSGAKPPGKTAAAGTGSAEERVPPRAPSPARIQRQVSAMSSVRHLNANRCLVVSMKEHDGPRSEEGRWQAKKKSHQQPTSQKFTRSEFFKLQVLTIWKQTAKKKESLVDSQWKTPMVQ